jgi:hypothetical protein
MYDTVPIRVIISISEVFAVEHQSLASPSLRSFWPLWRPAFSLSLALLSHSTISGPEFRSCGVCRIDSAINALAFARQPQWIRRREERASDLLSLRRRVRRLQLKVWSTSVPPDSNVDQHASKISVNICGGDVL